MAEVVSTRWERLPALELRAGDNTAMVLPGIGGNLLSLKAGETAFLRTPANLDAYLALPEAYGVPVLFPPNRIDGATFKARGKEYRLPCYKDAAFHLHGFLFERPWQVERVSSQHDTAEVELSFTAGVSGEIAQWFPHAFRARLSYRLEKKGLFQQVSFENLRDNAMPFMLGFHTAFALPGREQDPESYRVRISLGDALKGTEQSAASEDYAAFTQGKVLRDKEVIFGQFLAQPFTDEQGHDCHGAVIENLKTGSRLRYLIDEQFPYWVIWNQNGDSHFLCIEPQTCAINAANLHEEQDRFGFRMLAGRETFSALNRFLIG
jgi:aldose 1-epimerase